MKGLVPLALVIAVLAFLYVEFALNFTFHWVTDGDLGIGLELPSSFHLVVPAAFVSWGTSPRGATVPRSRRSASATSSAPSPR